MRAVFAALVAAILFSSCVYVPKRQPPETAPTTEEISSNEAIPACALSCASGRWFGQPSMHICVGGSLFMKDISVVGGETRRGDDGSVITSAWIARKVKLNEDRKPTYDANGKLIYEVEGIYDSDSVELRRCRQVMFDRCMALPSEQRGARPGEPACTALFP